MSVHRPIQNDKAAPPDMMDCTSDYDWWAAISMSWLNAGIDQPLALPTVTMAYGEPELFTDDAVSPVTKVPDSVCPWAHSRRRRRLCNKVSLGSGRTPEQAFSSQKSVYNNLGSRVPVKIPNYRHTSDKGQKWNSSFWQYDVGDGVRGKDIFYLPRRRTWLMHLCVTPVFPPTNTDNCPALTIKKMPKNMLRQTLRYDASNNTWKQKDCI